jgi:hypothetical protein
VATLADFKKAQDSLVREAQLDINKSVDNTSWEWGYSNDTVQYSICHFKKVGCNGRFTYPINRIDLDSQYCAEMNNMITVHHDTESPLILTQYIYIYIFILFQLVEVSVCIAFFTVSMPTNRRSWASRNAL